MKGLKGFLQASVLRKDISKLINGLEYPCWMPFYHTVSDQPLAHIKHLYPLKSVELFEQELEFYLKHFTIVSQEDICQKRGQKPNLFLSFDDGLIEFDEIIAPILYKKGVPATVFLNSNFVDNKDLFFRYKASILASELEARNTGSDIQNSISELLKIDYANKELLDSLAKDMAIDFKDYLDKKPIYLSTDQIKHWKHRGFDFGAHSQDHPLYEKLNLQEQLSQTRNCIEELKSLLGFPINSFSFPFTDFGVFPTFFSELKKDYPELLTFGTSGLKLDPVDNHYHRLPMDDSLGKIDDFFIKNIQRYHLKRILGKHIYKR